MNASVRFPLEVFFDGSCAICTAAMRAYRKCIPESRLRFIDISDSGFDPTPFGRSSADFMEKMHVRDSDGRFYTDVEGIWAIGQAFPLLSLHRLLGFVISLPIVSSAARSGYRLMARYRHLVWKRQGSCETGCCPKSI